VTITTSLSEDTWEKTFGAYLAELNSVGEPHDTIPVEPTVRSDPKPPETESNQREEVATTQEAVFSNRLFQLLTKHSTAVNDLNDVLPSGPKRACYGQAGTGSAQGENPSTTLTAMPGLANSLSFMEKISPALNSSSKQPKTPLRGSSPLSESRSSKESHLISTLSSLQSSTLWLMKIGRHALECHSLLSAQVNLVIVKDFETRAGYG